MDGPSSTHLLSLKVMRVSRPELASAWQPFYSSSPSFSAHSTASIASLQGTSPLPGYPKTLRDLTQASELLTLPSSFGIIQLGETFSSCLCINNESQVDVNGVSMKVEIQTATAKVALLEVGGPEYKLLAGDTFERIVSHEIKELGQHVLACTVTYQSPPNNHQLLNDPDSNDDLQTFRKFYKFAVTNPLSVKTKVHTPRSPTALMSPSERDKVFLEVHIQNLTQEPLYFERMQFECVEGWDKEDASVTVNADGEQQSLFTGSMALMQPQDTRQYVYILSPKSISLAPMVYTPGSVIPLGRLDIGWRSSFGEPGRLLTSVLSRRIPLLPAPVQQPASALPPYLKRSVVGTPPSRPQSPRPIQSRPGSPTPSRPHSPPPLVSSVRPQSPFQMAAVATPMFPIEATLIVRESSHTHIKVDKPLNISFALILSSPLHIGYRRRIIKVAIQHLQAQRDESSIQGVPAPPELFSPRLPSSGFSTPSSTTPTFNYALAHQKILMASRRDPTTDETDGRTSHRIARLPTPFFSGSEGAVQAKSPNVIFMGSSTLFLPSVELTRAGKDIHGHTTEQTPLVYAVQEFMLSYLPIKTGHLMIGGLRVLLVEDKILEDDESWDGDSHDEMRETPNQARILNEWDVIAEVWVTS